MKTLRSFMLTEAYSRDKTVANFKDKIEARVSTPKELKVTSETPDYRGNYPTYSYTPESADWHDHLQAWKAHPDAYEPRFDDSHIIGHLGFADRGKRVGEQTSMFHDMDLDTPIRQQKQFKKAAEDQQTSHEHADFGFNQGVYGADERDRLHAEIDHPDKPTRFKLRQESDHLTNREADMTPREYAHHKFMGDLEAALPHPKYVQAALRMYTNPNGGIHRTEDMFSTVADAFHKYHAIASKGKLLADQRVKSPLGSTYDDMKKHADANWEYENVKDMIGLTHVASGIPITQEYVDAKKKESDKGFPLHSEFQRFDKYIQLSNVVNHQKYKRILDPVPEVSDAKEGVDYEKVHEDEHQTVYHPKTEHGAWVLAHDPHSGEKASWCTAPDPKNKNAHNYFNSYHNQGPMLIVHQKDPNHKVGMVQIHTASDQWMNSHNEDVDHAYEHTHGMGTPEYRGEGAMMSDSLDHRATGWSNERIVNNTEDHPNWDRGDGRLHSETGVDQHVMWKIDGGSKGQLLPHHRDDEYTKMLPHLLTSNDHENDIPHRAQVALQNVIDEHGTPLGPKTKKMIMRGPTSLSDYRLRIITRPDAEKRDIDDVIRDPGASPDYIKNYYPEAWEKMEKRKSFHGL